jgi:hypothetical protein
MQDLPENKRRFGGRKVADSVTIDVCRKLCSDNRGCQALDYNENERWCLIILKIEINARYLEFSQILYQNQFIY